MEDSEAISQGVDDLEGTRGFKWAKNWLHREGGFRFGARRDALASGPTATVLQKASMRTRASRLVCATRLGWQGLCARHMGRQRCPFRPTVGRRSPFGGQVKLARGVG